MSNDQKLHQKETTAQLLATTDANLKKIAGRQLTPIQQGILTQIQAYTQQSKHAADSGDSERAYILAFKARLLSDDLARR